MKRITPSAALALLSVFMALPGCSFDGHTKTRVNVGLELADFPLVTVMEIEHEQSTVDAIAAGDPVRGGAGNFWLQLAGTESSGGWL